MFLENLEKLKSLAIEMPLIKIIAASSDAHLGQICKRAKHFPSSRALSFPVANDFVPLLRTTSYKYSSTPKSQQLILKNVPFSSVLLLLSLENGSLTSCLVFSNACFFNV